MTTFVTVLADPPWKYRDKLKMSEVARSSESHYDVMTTDEVCALAATEGHTIAGHQVAHDAFLWLWVTNPFLLNGDGVRVCRAWGFEPKQLITWVKGRLETTKTCARCGGSGEYEGEYGPRPCLACIVGEEPDTTVTKLVNHLGMGHYTRGCTEHLILATRGKVKALVKDRSVPNVFIAPRTTHSRKPDESFKLIEGICPGPYLELFAARRRGGEWTAWGNELLDYEPLR